MLRPGRWLVNAGIGVAQRIARGHSRSGRFGAVERGGSAIIAPDARYIVEPVYDREELIVADLDLSEIDQEVMTLDVSGHYARSDVFTFETKSEE